VNIQIRETVNGKNIVWVAISSHGILGPFFFDGMVMLSSVFVPELLGNRLLINAEWFVQCGARSHMANVVFDILHGIFGPQVISSPLFRSP
jgi:hypothetical protein